MSVTVVNGDCRQRLAELPAESVHCIVTSPPYFGLRDYGTAQWEGGDPDCDHLPKVASRESRPSSGLTGGKATVDAGTVLRGRCHCGARRVDNQIGLEATPDAFVAELVAVFRECRRVLRADGTLWLNLGDSYNAQGAGNKTPSGFSQTRPSRRTGDGNQETVKTGRGLVDGLKPKDLLGVPWMVAFALRADGWWLRQDIIWSKPNPMPESVTDRCTKSHEYLFLLSKSATYHYDADAVKEAATEATNERDKYKRTGYAKETRDGYVNHLDPSREFIDCGGQRNRRSVWTVATQPFSEAHFATFPPDLIEPCIKAGCPPQGTVLDPFGGAGTTGLVADRLGRNAILIELNPAYAEMARNRINGDAGMFAEVAVA